MHSCSKEMMGLETQAASSYPEGKINRETVDSLIYSPGQSLINLLNENDRRDDGRQSGNDKEPRIIL